MNGRESSYIHEIKHFSDNLVTKLPPRHCLFIFRSSYLVVGQIYCRHAVHMSTADIVGQVDTQHHRQHKDSEETEQQSTGPGHPYPVAARDGAAAVARMQRLVLPTGPGHDSVLQYLCNRLVSRNSYVSKSWSMQEGNPNRKWRTNWGKTSICRWPGFNIMIHPPSLKACVLRSQFASRR